MLQTLKKLPNFDAQKKREKIIGGTVVDQAKSESMKITDGS